MDQQTLISVLAWACVTMGGAFCILVAYFARRIVYQLDTLTDQGNALKALVVDEIHRLELRVSKLEDWRDVLITGGYLTKP